MQTGRSCVNGGLVGQQQLCACQEKVRGRLSCRECCSPDKDGADRVDACQKVRGRRGAATRCFEYRDIMTSW